MMADPFSVQMEGLKRGLSPSTHAHPRPLSDRDLAILLAIDQYRYLDRDHVTDLFFPGRRSAELCLKDLLWRGLIYRWPVVRWQGSPIKPSVYGLTSSGARRVAQLRGQDPRPIRDRARRAREQTYHLRHDLEANRFFTKLAAGRHSLPLLDHGCRDGFGNWLAGCGVAGNHRAAGPTCLRRHARLPSRHPCGKRFHRQRPLVGPASRRRRGSMSGRRPRLRLIDGTRGPDSDPCVVGPQQPPFPIVQGARTLGNLHVWNREWTQGEHG